MEKVQFHPRPSELRCAYCHDPIREEKTYSCPQCQVVLHEDCRESLKQCPTLACAGSLKISALQSETPELRPPSSASFEFTLLFATGLLCWAISMASEFAALGFGLIAIYNSAVLQSWVLTTILKFAPGRQFIRRWLDKWSQSSPGAFRPSHREIRSGRARIGF